MRKFKWRVLPALLAIVAFAVAFAPPAFANTITLSSGVTPVLVTDSVFGGPVVAKVVPPCCSAWAAPITGSQWISPRLDYLGFNTTYTTTFVLPANALSPSLSVISMADNSANISLNTTQFQTRNTAACRADFLAPLTASTTSGFVVGVNTLSFAVDNCIGGFGLNATGLDFVATVTYSLDTTPPSVSVSLVPIKVEAGEGLFAVSFSCTDDVGVVSSSASLNGIAVSDGQRVKLELSDDSSTRFHKGLLKIEAPSFLLKGTCADAAGNVGTATASPTFAADSDDDSDSDSR